MILLVLTVSESVSALVGTGRIEGEKEKSPDTILALGSPLFASDLFPAGLQIGEISSDLKRIGSRGRTRTGFTVSDVIE